MLRPHIEEFSNHGSIFSPNHSGTILHHIPTLHTSMLGAWCSTNRISNTCNTIIIIRVHKTSSNQKNLQINLELLPKQTSGIQLTFHC